MNVTKHAIKRYVERIDGISKEEVGGYISVNETRIHSNIETMYEHAQLIWRGQLYDNITRNYYLNKDIILVTSTDNSAIITLYRIDFGFPTHTNRSVISDLREHIMELQEEYEEAEQQLQEEKDALDHQIDFLDKQIKIMLEQVESLKAQHKVKTDERKTMTTKNLFLAKEIERNAVMLCNSLDYKNDLKEMIK